MGMKASSKWTKWQIGLVSAMIVVYLFQEVKESPEFLAAVQKASNSMLNTTTVVAQKKQDVPPSESFDRNSGNRMKRSASSSRGQLNQSDSSSAQSLPQSQTQNNTQTHTRSHAS